MKQQTNQDPAVVARVKAILADVGKTADGIACELARKGVKKALCGHEFKCALAQHIANQLNMKGYCVSVGSRVHVYKGTPSKIDNMVNPKLIANVAVGQAGLRFINAFDDGRYPFLGA